MLPATVSHKPVNSQPGWDMEEPLACQLGRQPCSPSWMLGTSPPMPTLLLALHPPCCSSRSARAANSSKACGHLQGLTESRLERGHGENHGWGRRHQENISLTQAHSLRHLVHLFCTKESAVVISIINAFGKEANLKANKLNPVYRLCIINIIMKVIQVSGEF